MNPDRMKVARQKVWQKLEPFSSDFLVRPQQGWLKTIREILGMTTYQFAKRIGISQPAAIATERREKEKSITLKALETAARALNCRLEYILIPNDSFEDTVRKRAELLAKKRVKETVLSMELEDQSVSLKDREEHIRDLTEKILRENSQRIWDEE